MTVTGSAGVHRDVEGSSRSSRRKWLVMVPVFAAVVASVGLWQWRSPDAFGEQGNEVGLYSKVGTTALVGIATPRPEIDPAVITLHAVEPQITKGEATVDVVVCHTGSGKDRIGTARGRVARYCGSQEAPDGARLRPNDELILRVRSNEPGNVVVDGLKVTYS